MIRSFTGLGLLDLAWLDLAWLDLAWLDLAWLDLLRESEALRRGFLGRLGLIANSISGSEFLSLRRFPENRSLSGCVTTREVYFPTLGQLQ